MIYRYSLYIMDLTLCGAFSPLFLCHLRLKVVYVVFHSPHAVPSESSPLASGNVFHVVLEISLTEMISSCWFRHSEKQRPQHLQWQQIVHVFQKKIKENVY